jgi:hypothetical protein
VSIWLVTRMSASELRAFPGAACLGLVEAGPEVLEDLAVVHAAGDDGAEHRGAGVTGDAEPVGPRAALAQPTEAAGLERTFLQDRHGRLPVRG